MTPRSASFFVVLFKGNNRVFISMDNQRRSSEMDLDGVVRIAGRVIAVEWIKSP